MTRAWLRWWLVLAWLRSRLVLAWECDLPGGMWPDCWMRLMMRLDDGYLRVHDGKLVNHDCCMPLLPQNKFTRSIWGKWECMNTILRDIEETCTIWAFIWMWTSIYQLTTRSTDINSTRWRWWHHPSEPGGRAFSVALWSKLPQCPECGRTAIWVATSKLWHRFVWYYGEIELWSFFRIL